MTKAGNSGMPHQRRSWVSTICEVDIAPDITKTLTRDRPIASS